MQDPIEAFIAGYTPDVQAVSSTLRAMVKSAMPGASEILFAKYNHIGYAWSESMRDRICYICPMKDYVRLGFMYGTHLPDPEQLLVGEGKRLRHVKVRSVQEASNSALEQLVKAAWVDARIYIKQKP